MATRNDLAEGIRQAMRDTQPTLYALLVQAIGAGAKPHELQRVVDEAAGRGGQGLTENAAAVVIDLLAAEHEEASAGVKECWACCRYMTNRDRRRNRCPHCQRVLDPFEREEEA